MSTVITIVHVTTCVLLVIMVLLQSGKGAEISASFGGSSQTVFGSSGGANFFVKLTAALAAIFFCTSLVLTIMGGQAKKSMFENTLFPTAAPTAPANPAAPAAPAAPGAATSQQQAPSAPAQQAPAAPAQH